jgi:RNA polymerase sigma factor (sigma-70 family)
MRLPDSDSELLAAYQVSRSEEIFRRLVAKHSPWVLRFCHRRLHSHEDAEDATQAVFLALARRPERVQYCLVGWLVQTARRAVRDLQRSAGRRARREEVVARSRRSFAPPDDRDDEVTLALSRLPTRLRLAVALRYLEGLNQREAAHRLGCPQGTLATRTRAGLLRLRDTLAPAHATAILSGRD